MASIQVDDEQVEEVTKPTTGKPELNSPAIDEEAPGAKTTETTPYFDEDEQEDEIKEVDKPEDKDDELEDEDHQEKLAAAQIIDEDDEDGVEPAFSSGGASRGAGNEFSEEEEDDHAHAHAHDDEADD